jgi:hypothetical protein
MEFTAMVRLLERICHPFSKVTPRQAALLIRYQEKSTATMSSSSVVSLLVNDSNPEQQPEQNKSGSPATQEKASEETNKKAEDLFADPKKVLVPFPVLASDDANNLCQTVLFTDCYHYQHHSHHDHHNSGLRKSLVRSMRSLALFQPNWKLLLTELGQVGHHLLKKTVEEFSHVHRELLEATSNHEDALSILVKRPHISRPKDLWELKLLNVLQIMTSLRKKKLSSLSSPETPAVQEMNNNEEEQVVSSAMRTMVEEKTGKNVVSSEETDRNDQIWDILHDCLDLIRDLEEKNNKEASDNSDRMEEDNHNTTNTPAANTSSGGMDHSQSNNNLQLNNSNQKNSSLTMRFIPLIECYLTIFSHTMLVKGGSGAGHGSGHVNHHNNNGTSNNQTPAVASEGGLELVKTSSVLPGAKFRQNNPNTKILSLLFQANQTMEIRDELAAASFHRFLERNSTLLNQILHQNRVHLLDSSFSILMKVHRCRSFLSFDNKRLYFKSKLKQLIKVMASRRSQYSSAGHLRIAVRRNSVFEESFQLLRHKNVDEMRRKLNITFLDEEGIDASGLTREWYTILAKEIFNPNYALFSLTSDGITFQPNAQSSINSYHLDYFKFIGRIIGKGICDSQLLDIHFTRSFYKHILGLPITLSDLESIDQEYYKSLMSTLATPLEVMGLDGELTFTLEENEFGKITVVELIPNGSNTLVTDQNKHEYVTLLAHHRMTSAIRRQVKKIPSLISLWFFFCSLVFCFFLLSFSLLLLLDRCFLGGFL